MRLITVQYLNLQQYSTLRRLPREEAETQKKAKVLYRWRRCGIKVAQHSRVRQQTSLRWLIKLYGSVILVSKLRLDTDRTVANVCCVTNLYKVLYLKHAKNE